MARELYLRRKAEGVCTTCGRAPALPDRVCCAVCGAKHGDPAKRRKRRHELEAMLDAAGLCRYCGRWPRADGTFACERCRRKRNRQWPQTARARIADGLCRQCGAFPLLTRTRCAVCLWRYRQWRRERSDYKGMRTGRPPAIPDDQLRELAEYLLREAGEAES